MRPSNSPVAMERVRRSVWPKSTRPRLGPRIPDEGCTRSAIAAAGGDGAIAMTAMGLGVRPHPRGKWVWRLWRHGFGAGEVPSRPESGSAVDYHGIRGIVKSFYKLTP